MDDFAGKNYLENIETISSASTKCGLNFTKLNHVGCEIAALSGFLELSSVQTIFFSCMAELSFQRTVTLDCLSKHMKCGVFKLLTYLSEFDILENKGYIKKTARKRGQKQSYNDLGYTVPHYVIEAIRQGDMTSLKDSSKYDLPAFLKQVNTLVEDRIENAVPTADMLSEVQFLINANLELPFVAYVDSGLKELVSKCAVFAFAYLRLKGQYAISVEGFSNSLFDDLSHQLEFDQQVLSGRHELVDNNFVKILSSEFDGERMVAIAPFAAKELYKDYPALFVIESKREGMIYHKDITSKNLYFSGDVMEQLRVIESALDPEMFSTYREELKKNALSSGVTAIFYGAPGTGKTEAVYQIARKTGRNVMMVDLSQTKSHWFGDSEKQVRKIFDDYAGLMRNFETEPILFINEADGLFTKRMELSNGRGSGADQVINTMQNILLQALENFEGILLATTNFTGNLDKAFERRFTFKVDFPKPDSTVRKYIWKNKLPDLTEKEAGIIGEQFDITGGEIDVQVRQIILKRVMRRKINLFDAVVDCCSRDHGFTGKRKIGFK